VYAQASALAAGIGPNRSRQPSGDCPAAAAPMAPHIQVTITSGTGHGHHPHSTRLPPPPAAAGTAFTRQRSASHQPRTDRAVRYGSRSHRPATLLLRVVDGRSSRCRDPRPGTALITAIADTALTWMGAARTSLRPSLTASLEGAAATAPPRGARWNGWLGDHLGTGPRHRRAQPRLARARRLAARCCSVKAIGIAGAQSARALTWVEPQGTSTPDPLHAMQFRPPPHRSSRRCAQPNGPSR